MKRCPECSAEYDERVSFCAQDGRSLIGVSAVAARLCPHCANSIAEDAAECPYCKAAVEPAPSPQWLIRDESPFGTRSPSRAKAMAPKAVLIAGIILCVLVAALFGTRMFGNSESSGTGGLLDQKLKELKIKEEHITAVEAELNKVRSEAADITNEAVALKARLEESQKELAAVQQRLTDAKRESERASMRRAQVESRSDPRPAERPVAPARPAQRPAEPGVYETLRPAEVHEQPVQSSRVISRVGGGTRINVVRSDGDWLEIVSKRGNPPGFILREHTKFVGATNN